MRAIFRILYSNLRNRLTMFDMTMCDKFSSPSCKKNNKAYECNQKTNIDIRTGNIFVRFCNHCIANTCILL